jgi:hypothetical protein
MFQKLLIKKANRATTLLVGEAMKAATQRVEKGID